MLDRSLATALIEQVRRRRARHARDAIMLLAVGAAALLVYPFFPDQRVVALAGVAIAAAIGVWLFVALVRRRSAALDQLDRRAGEVVWVFTEIGERDVREASLVFAFGDGTSVTIPVEPDAASELLASASLAFATASIGFTRELREGYQRDPHSLLGPPRRAPVDVAGPVSDYAWLVGPARAVMRGSRLLGGLGVLLGVLGAVGLAIVFGAAPAGEERTVLAAVFALVVASGIGLGAVGFRPFERTALYRALRDSDGLSSVQLVEGHDAIGDVVPMAVVTLKSGARYTFLAPHPPTAPRRAAPEKTS